MYTFSTLIIPPLSLSGPAVDLLECTTKPARDYVLVLKAKTTL